MQTRIREYRKRHGLTLQQLADKVGTTPQTVQRLETANMTVSMDWLGRFAEALGVRVADLIAEEPESGIRLLGRMRRAGMAAAQRSQEDTEIITLSAPAEDPVAVRLEEDIGPYRRGSIVIGNRLRGPDIVNAHGHDCIVAAADGAVALRRVLLRDGRATLVPLDESDDVRFDVDLAWAARLVMTVRYLQG